MFGSTDSDDDSSEGSDYSEEEDDEDDQEDDEGGDVNGDRKSRSIFPLTAPLYFSSKIALVFLSHVEASLSHRVSLIMTRHVYYPLARFKHI